jgi:peptidoglycan/LPS O-acetylase OafA/YrhL
VISGFVIAQSIATDRISLKYAATFLARRLLRLSPPYWATVVFVVVTTYVARQLLADYGNEMPSLGSVIAHLAYLYPFFGYEPILDIFWTLVHTVQFYFLFTLLFAILQKCWGCEQPSPAGALLLFVLPGVVSAVGVPGASGLCVNTWYMFCLGVFAYWWHRRWVPTWLCVFFLACVALSLIGDGGSHKLTALVSAMLIMLASRLGTLGVWLGGRLLQFFGRISYSLFLIHGTIGWRVLSIGDRLTGPEQWFAAGWLCLAVGSSVVAAYLLYRCVELPSVRLSRRLKRG